MIHKNASADIRRRRLFENHKHHCNCNKVSQKLSARYQEPFKVGRVSKRYKTAAVCLRESGFLYRFETRTTLAALHAG